MLRVFADCFVMAHRLFFSSSSFTARPCAGSGGDYVLDWHAEKAHTKSSHSRRRRSGWATSRASCERFFAAARTREDEKWGP